MQIAPAHLRLARHAGVRRLLQEAGLDALLVTSLSNVAYLSGLFASAAAIVITRDRFAIITDGRYLGIAKGVIEDLSGVETRDNACFDPVRSRTGRSPVQYWARPGRLRGDAFHGETVPRVGNAPR
jgi:Xaa-Pro aminopeptidase